MKVENCPQPYIPTDLSGIVAPKKYFFTVVAYFVTKILPIKIVPGKMFATSNF